MRHGALLLSTVLHDVVEGAERHDGREAEQNHELQPLRLNGPVDGFEDLKLVEQRLRLILEHETAEQERQQAPNRGTSLRGGGRGGREGGG